MPALEASRKSPADSVAEEYRILQTCVGDKNFPEFVDVTRVNPMTLRIKLSPQDQRVAREMRDNGVAAVEVEAMYPEDYPASPFFLRVVTPSVKPYTGFISCQGAILMECLVKGEGLRKWDAGLTVDFVLIAWLAEACNASFYQINSPGQGRQTAGPLTVAPGCGNGYSEAGARSDFARCVAADRWY